MIRHLQILILLICIGFFPGCRGIGVKHRAQSTDLSASWKHSLGQEDLSARTRQSLRSWDLERLYDEKPVEVVEALQARVEKSKDPELLFALSEICYRLGKKSETTACACSLDYYYLCAGYAFHYLYSNGTNFQNRLPLTLAANTSGRFDRGTSPFDPRFRAACALYNLGVSRCIRAAQRVNRLDAQHALHIPTCDRQGFTLLVTHTGFPWKAEEFGELLFVEDYEPVGLKNHHRTYGLGVPLIATRRQNAQPPDKGQYPPAVSFPVTAFLRFKGSLSELRAYRAGRLELYNPLAIQAITVRDIYTPLETDLTTPLAYFLAQNDLSSIGLKGFLNPDEVEGHAGLYLMEPYQPGKIPVVMVHGLLSSPITWAPMFNDLQSDPRIRERYQFWFYLYPTSHSYLKTAADLREGLQYLRKDLDPGGRDDALDNMVLVSHSMGGLVSKLLTVDSGDRFWKLMSDEPFEKLDVGSETKHALRRALFFKRQPYIKRVVFLGTPHRGSRLSPSFPGRVVRRFISLPARMTKMAKELAQAGPNKWFGKNADRLPLSLDLLAPNAPALQVLAELNSSEALYHSIIGDAPCSTYVAVERFLAGEDPKQKGDGVVPYQSAHLASADSEVIVKAEHTEVHHHPLAVQEVRRILYQHGGRQTNPVLRASFEK